jgi:ABC-type lipoprotein release transport system permease subunit
MLAVVTMLFRTEFFHRWRSWLYLALLVALVSGLVLAGIAAGRQTASAYPRYLATYGSDAEVFGYKPIPTIASLPEVTLSKSALIPANGPPACKGCRLLANQNFGVVGLAPKEIAGEVKLLSGRMPDQSKPAEVLASYTMQRDLGIRLGSHVRIRFASAKQRNAILNGTHVAPDGPRYDFTVVGTEASESEFPSASGTNYDLYTTEAFTRSIRGRTVFFHSDFVRLRHGAADLPRLQAQARQVGALGITDLDANATAVTSSIRPQAVGWWILAGLTALVGLIVLAQAQSRQASLEEDAYGTLRTLGVTERQLFVVGMARTAVIGVAGIAGGLLLAYGLSSLTPVGEARLADPTNGFSFDTWALLLAGLVMLAVFLALGVRPAVAVARAARSGGRLRLQRPSRTVGLLADAGASASTLIGVRRALQRGAGRSTVPVGSAIVGSILAVTALCATAVFGSSLTHLTTTPSLYGQPFNLYISINSAGTPAQAEQMVDDIKRERTVTGITAGISGDVTINGHTVAALGGQPIRGSVLLTTITGRLPTAPNEVTMGATTLREVGAHVGSLVRVSVPNAHGGTKTSAYRVVGVTPFPPDFGTGGLGTGAVFDFAGFGARCPSGMPASRCAVEEAYTGAGVILVQTAPGAAGRSALNRLVAANENNVSLPLAPTNLVNFGQDVNFPVILGSVLIVFGVVSLLHVLVVSVTRRRQEVGLLKSLGFLRRQVASAVLWQTTTVALIGLVVGIPLGVAIGRLVWRAFAGYLGVVPVPVVTPWEIGAIALGALVVANLLAVGPAIVAARIRPARLLRAE